MMLFIVVVVFILIGVLLTWFLLANDPGEKEPVSALWIALGLGFIGALAAGPVENLLISKSALLSNTASLSTLAATLTVGVIEESFKFIPLALFIYRKKYFNEYTDGVIYFAIAGLGFGIPENILYSLSYGSSIGFLRMILTPMLHACTTCLVGYFLIKKKIEKRSILLPIGALLAAILIHGIYDFGLSSGSGGLATLSLLITAGLTVSLFMFYLKATDLDQKYLSTQPVPAASNFCQFCGAPNASHKAYCTKCGRHV